MTLNSITLTSSSGASVPLFDNAQYVDFMGLNGGSEPLVTASVPPGEYTSATVTYSGANIVCVSANAGITVSIYADYGDQPQAVSPATVSLPSPITISGTTMALALTLPVAQSMRLSGCTLPAQYSIAPVFTLAPIDLAAMPTDSLNGASTYIDGRVVSVGTAGSSFALSTNSGSVNEAYGHGLPVSYTTDATTVFEGISGLAQLTSGMFVDMDQAIQPDGTLLATRVAVEDPYASNVFIGPLLEVDPLGYITVLGRFEQGDKLSIDPVNFDYYMVASDTVYKVAGGIAGINGLPFQASFTQQTMVPGQSVAVASGPIPYGGSDQDTLVTTLTLLPQTFNGKIGSIATDGPYTTYTVDLAPYDLIPTLSSMSQIVVYADSSTRTLNSSALTAGSLVRVHGLLFNDAGTLRVACDQINDGVAE